MIGVMQQVLSASERGNYLEALALLNNALQQAFYDGRVEGLYKLLRASVYEIVSSIMVVSCSSRRI